MLCVCLVLIAAFPKRPRACIINAHLGGLLLAVEAVSYLLCLNMVLILHNQSIQRKERCEQADLAVRKWRKITLYTAELDAIKQEPAQIDGFETFQSELKPLTTCTLIQIYFTFPVNY